MERPQHHSVDGNPRRARRRGPSVAFFVEHYTVDDTRSLGDHDALLASHLDAYRNIRLSKHAHERMRTAGISSLMVAQTLNAPARVQRLPLSNTRSFFREFGGRTLRVTTNLDDAIVSVSWTANGSSGGV